MTYVILSVVVLALIALATLGVLRRLPARPLLLTALVLVVLTAVFDNVIVGLDIVAYDDAKISGLRLWHAPIEDFAYALGAVMLIPALWMWLAPKQPDGTEPKLDRARPSNDSARANHSVQANDDGPTP